MRELFTLHGQDTQNRNPAATTNPTNTCTFQHFFTANPLDLFGLWLKSLG